MDDDFYKKNLHLLEVGRFIGSQVNERILSTKMNRSQFANLIFSRLEYSGKNSAQSYLSTVTSGVSLGYINNSPRFQQLGRSRLSALLHQLAFSQDDEVISKIKNVDPFFVYPPLERKRTR